MRHGFENWAGRCGLALATLVLVACGSGSGDSTAPGVRQVRFEVVGSHSGTLSVITTTSLGNPAIRPAAALPWVFDTTFGPEIRGVGMGGQTDLARRGRDGETANARIYVNGVLVSQTGVQTAATGGLIALPTLSYVFP
jgi:hypothetical protein